MINRRIIIIFPDSWLPYSPTVINLANCLMEQQFEVDVYWVDTGSFNAEIVCKWSHRLVINRSTSIILAKLRLLNFVKLLLLFNSVKNKKETHKIVGVDSLGYIVGRLCRSKCIWLSLEANRNTWYRIASSFGVDELIIQSERRARYLFPHIQKQKITILPNSPTYVGAFDATSKSLSATSKIKFIYFGNIIRPHGVEKCIEAVIEYGRSSTITLQGPITKEYLQALKAKYGSLIGRQIYIRSGYIEQNSITSYLGDFDIGFVTYDFAKSKMDFNYQTCPSGKMYNYFNAGIPMIGSDIIGLHDIKELDAGLLVDTDSTEEILVAIKKITDDYKRYAYNSKRASKHFDFQSRFESAILPLFNGPE